MAFGFRSGRAPKLRRTVLPNGLTVLSEVHPDAKSVALGVWIRVGTRHESAREAGMSHFLEHMLFKGTERRTASEIARAIDRVGGELNAFTARECTCYHATLLARDLELGVDVLGDVLLHSQIDAIELERERKVILQEIAMVEESPEEVIFDAWFDAAYPGDGLGRPILGSVHRMRRHRRRELLAFLRRYYRPEQVVVVAAGRFSHARLLQLVESRLGGRRWPGREPRARAAVGQRAAMQAKRTTMLGKTRTSQSVAARVRVPRLWQVRDTEQTHVLVGMPGPRYGARDQLAARLVSLELGGGMSSRLFQEIRERHGLAYSVYSTLTPFTDHGTLHVYAAVAHSQVAHVCRLIEEVLLSARRRTLSPENLQALKGNLQGTLLLNSESVESRMISLGKSELFYPGHATPEQVCQAIERVTLEQWARAARKLIPADPASWSCLVLGPRPERALARKLGLRVVS